MHAPDGFNPNASLLEQNATAPIQAFRGGGISAKPFYEAILRALSANKNTDSNRLPPDATITSFKISVENNNFVLKLLIKGKKLGTGNEEETTEEKDDETILREARDFLLEMEVRDFLLKMEARNFLRNSSQQSAAQRQNLPFGEPLPVRRRKNPQGLLPLSLGQSGIPLGQSLSASHIEEGSTSKVPIYPLQGPPSSENTLQEILGSNHPRGTFTDSKYESEYESKLPSPSERSQENIDEEEISAVVAAVQKEEKVRESRVNKLIDNLRKLQTNVSARRQRPSTAGRALTSNEETKLTTLMKNNQNLTMNVEKLISEIKTGTANPE